MRRKTRQNTIIATIGSTPTEILPPNPLRKSFMMCPIGGGQALTSRTFEVPATTSFVVPSGVETYYDCFLWGSGGDGAIDADPDSGGGGGGGAFARTGPQSAIPGSSWNYRVSTHGSGFSTFLQNSLGGIVGRADSGISGLLTVGGAGGVFTTGLEGWDGGAGGAGVEPLGGGGGGSAGYGSVGGTAVGQVAGTAGGITTFMGFGAGAAGGTGASGAAAAIAGGSPGGGGGGGSSAFPAPADGGNGKIILFYFSPIILLGQSSCISMSHRQDVAPGQGTINYVPNWTQPFIVSDDEIGDAVGLPWWIVSGVADVVVQIVEYSYDCTFEDLEY